MKRIPKNSLRAFFRKQAIKWSLIGLCLVLVFALPAFFWIIKTASEKHLLSLAETTTFAFRPRITSPVGDIRAVQAQMIDTVHLKLTESIVIRDTELKAIYNNGNPNEKPACPPSKLACWINHFSQIEHLEPIYFSNDSGGSLFGYADYKVNPVFDHTWFLIFVFLVPVIFIIQALGLSAALDNSSATVTDKLSQWAKQVRKPENSPSENKEMTAPFKEFEDMQTAINGLQNEIVRLQGVAVDDVKSKLHLAVLQEVGHDLRNPISQVEKYFAVLVASTLRTGTMDLNKVEDVERTLKRVKDVSEQVKGLQDGLASEEKYCSIVEQGKILLSDMAQNSDVIERKIQFKFDAEENVGTTQIAPVAFQRIFENLLRNAIDAVPDGGAVEVNIRNRNGRPTLIVIDNGHGIADEHKNQIFDFLFTTKGTRGTGLGLGIVKNLCTFFGADVQFQSALNRGTTFQISFVPAGEIGVAV